MGNFRSLFMDILKRSGSKIGPFIVHVRLSHLRSVDGCIKV